MPPVLLDVDELAERLSASPKDVASWARRGLIPSVRVSGRRYFNIAAVVKTIRQRQEAEKAEAVPA